MTVQVTRAPSSMSSVFTRGKKIKVTEVSYRRGGKGNTAPVEYLQAIYYVKPA